MLTTAQRIQHLHRRLGFGLSPAEWRASHRQSFTQVVTDLFAQAKRVPDLLHHSAYAELEAGAFRQLGKKQKRALQKEDRQYVIDQIAAWVTRMADPTESTLLERMTLFWHGHFACESKRSDFVAQHLAMLRRHALGNFRDLLIGVSQDAAMLRYLNNQQNKKNAPNENYARELMELFTIGRGHYTEQDVKEAARAFTGWMSGPLGRFFRNPRQHDTGTKTFMGRTGNLDGEDIIDRLLERKETAIFVARKLYRYFVNARVDELRVRELADQCYQSGYDIGHTMHYLATRDWFYDPLHVGAKIKSPIALIAGMLRTLDGRFVAARELLIVQRLLGQQVFAPPNVAGWPGGRRWIDNSTLLLRLNLPVLMYKASDLDLQPKRELSAPQQTRRANKLKTTLDFTALSKAVDQTSAERTFVQLEELLLPGTSRLAYNRIRPYVQKENADTLLQSMTLRLMGLPEYQMC